MLFFFLLHLSCKTRFQRSTRLYQFQAPSENKYIQETDASERLQIQLLRSGSTPLDADSLTSESNWIFDHLTKSWISNTHLANAVKVDDIRRFLVLQHVEKLDLPFIAMYRREDCLSLFKDPDQLEDYPPDQDKSEPKVAQDTLGHSRFGPEVAHAPEAEAGIERSLSEVL